MIPKTRLLAWSSWTPAQEPPDLSHLPALLRRRMSPLTRMAVSVGLQCCQQAGEAPATPRVVFASRHGEMGVTGDLLSQMAAGDPLSPTDFSNSVHHAAAAYWSLATGDQQAIRAVAGGEASFCYGFLDAIGMLGETDHAPVLLIAADAALPPPFDVVAGSSGNAYAAAFLLARAAPEDQDAFTFTMEGCAAQRSPGIPALDFLQWFLKGEAPLELNLSRRLWRWEK